jgi:hypothetical protein
LQWHQIVAGGQIRKVEHGKLDIQAMQTEQLLSLVPPKWGNHCISQSVRRKFV